MCEHSIVDEINNHLLVYQATGNGSTAVARLLEKVKAHIEGEQKAVQDRIDAYQGAIGKVSPWPAHPDCAKCNHVRERMRAVSAKMRQKKRDNKRRPLKVVGGAGG